MVRKEIYDFYLKHKCSEYKGKEKNDMATNDKTSGYFRYVCPDWNCLIVGYSTLTGVDEKRLSNNYNNYKKFEIFEVQHHLIPLLNKKPEHIILHTGTIDAVWKTSRQIFDELL